MHHSDRSSSPQSSLAGPEKPAPAAVTTAAMRADHAAWLASLARWRDDVARWQAEHRDLVGRLAEMQRAVAEHGTALDAHAATFVDVERAVADHDRAIAGRPPEATVPHGDQAATRHPEEADLLRRHHDAHDRIARHHEEVVARMTALEQAAAAPL